MTSMKTISHQIISRSVAQLAVSGLVRWAIGPPMSQDQIASLFDQGEEQGCVNLSYLNEVVTELELDEDDIERLYEQLEERGIDVTDDCRRPTATTDEATYVNGDLV